MIRSPHSSGKFFLKSNWYPSSFGYFPTKEEGERCWVLLRDHSRNEGRGAFFSLSPGSPFLSPTVCLPAESSLHCPTVFLSASVSLFPLSFLSFYHSLISTSPISSSPLGSPLSLSTCIISISIPICPSLPPRLWSSFGVSVPQFLFALTLRLCHCCPSACVPLSHSPTLGLSVPVFIGLPVFLSWSLLLSVSHPLSVQPCPCFGLGLCPCHPVTPVSPTPCTSTSLLYPTS